jgi:uncharacterized membrane protein
MTTEKIRVNASSVIRSVPDVRPTATSWRRETGGVEGVILLGEVVYSVILGFVMLRRACLAGSAVWAAILPLAAFAASRPNGTSLEYTFALSAYAIGHAICHQLPARSFHMWGASLPVCARCTGIYVGAAVAAMAAWVRPNAVGLTASRARRWLLAALVPTAMTLVYEWTTGVMPANWIRALAGLPLGAGVAWMIGTLNFEP